MHNVKAMQLGQLDFFFVVVLKPLLHCHVVCHL